MSRAYLYEDDWGCLFWWEDEEDRLIRMTVPEEGALLRDALALLRGRWAESAEGWTVYQRSDGAAQEYVSEVGAVVVRSELRLVAELYYLPEAAGWLRLTVRGASPSVRRYAGLLDSVTEGA